VGRWFERAALGALMTAVAFVAERRLMKVLRRRDETAEPEMNQGLELATSEQVDQQPDG
jgi:hypothetical protein